MVMHEHDVPDLPETAPPDRSGDHGLTCPAMLNDGTVCGMSMVFAHNVREYYPVRSWVGGVLSLGEYDGVGDSDEEDPHLWCCAGHDWAVPAKVEFES